MFGSFQIVSGCVDVCGLCVYYSIFCITVDLLFSFTAHLCVTVAWQDSVGVLCSHQSPQLVQLLDLVACCSLTSGLGLRGP